MTPTETLASLLDQASKQLGNCSDSALLDAEVLLCHCLNKPRTYLRTWPEHQPDDEQIRQFQTLIAQRSQGVPVAYLTGHREFWSRDFLVTPDVLIPRPDSELLIEQALALLTVTQHCKIIDLGTGSGILAITLAAERPLATVFASDFSKSALAVAQLNAKRLQTGNVRFIYSNWFDAIDEDNFDLVLSNPPYIADDDPHLRQGDLRFEPQTALVSPNQGLQDIAMLAEQARHRLKPAGHLLVEHGYNQQHEVQTIFQRYGYQKIATQRDFSGNPRITTGQWNPL